MPYGQGQQQPSSASIYQKPSTHTKGTPIKNRRTSSKTNNNQSDIMTAPGELEITGN